VTRQVKVPLTLSTLGQALDLHETQRVLQVYVTGDPHVVWVVIEGGDELPEDPSTADGRGRDFGDEVPIVRHWEIPKPS
jgi:hypothetical protein